MSLWSPESCPCVQAVKRTHGRMTGKHVRNTVVVVCVAVAALFALGLSAVVKASG